jgi:carbohydrate diacid regulator
MNKPFKFVAAAIVEQLSQLLSAQVVILNGQGAIAATSEAKGYSMDSCHSKLETDCLRGPICIDGQAGEVLIAQSMTGEALSPRPAQMLVELMIHRVTSVVSVQGVR